MTYLIKRLQHQELGSVNPSKPNPARGRYLFMSKNPDFLKHLPHLSQNILNDFQIITLIPLYKSRFERNYCTFVYNNDKYHGGGGSNNGKPRDEYRIYSNRALEDYQLLFQTDDILVLKPYTLTNCVNGVQENEQIYFSYLVNDHQSDLYTNLAHLINESPLRGNYAILDDEIPIIEHRIHQILDTRLEASLENEFNEDTARQVSRDIATRSQDSNASIDNLFTNQHMFRNFLQVGYDNLCAVTRQAINCGTFNNLQAAHIYPRSHGGSYTPNNGILMNRDMHWAFDIGCFTINDDYTMRVHPEVDSASLQSLNGQTIFIPDQEFFRPAIENLHYHQENVYGSFLTRGRL